MSSAHHTAAAVEAEAGDFQPRSFLGDIGYYGPITMMATLLTVLCLQGEYSMIVYVLLWQVANYYLNAVLKNTLRQPRPVGPLPSANIEYLERHKYYGMPSGHVQLVVSMGVFTMLVLVRQGAQSSVLFKNITTVAVPILAAQMGVTMWQRVSYQRHDIPQVLVGGGIGAVFALLFYRVAYAYRK